MRELAEEHLKNVLGCSQSDAKKLSHSCVSQRDIQVCVIDVHAK